MEIEDGYLRGLAAVSMACCELCSMLGLMILVGYVRGRLVCVIDPAK